MDDHVPVSDSWLLKKAFGLDISQFYNFYQGARTPASWMTWRYIQYTQQNSWDMQIHILHSSTLGLEFYLWIYHFNFHIIHVHYILVFCFFAFVFSLIILPIFRILDFFINFFNLLCSCFRCVSLWCFYNLLDCHVILNWVMSLL